jgi:hypothetical protein
MGLSGTFDGISQAFILETRSLKSGFLHFRPQNGYFGDTREKAAGGRARRDP